jgi:hypothetical protein
MQALALAAAELCLLFACRQQKRFTYVNYGHWSCKDAG